MNTKKQFFQQKISVLIFSRRLTIEFKKYFYNKIFFVVLFSQIRYYNDMEMFCGGKPVQWDQNGKIY